MLRDASFSNADFSYVHFGDVQIEDSRFSRVEFIAFKFTPNEFKIQLFARMSSLVYLMIGFV